MAEITRRTFVNQSVASLGAASIGAMSTSVLGANEKVRAALIGSGGMGRGDMLTFLTFDEVDCPLICDVDDAQIAKVADAIEKKRGKRPEAVKDFRTVMDRKDIDVCVVATPDHWHALPTIHACQAGKDVYVEKPLATSVGEGRAMLDAARKHGRVVQMGTQWRNNETCREAIEYVHSGKLGTIRLVRCWAYLTWVDGVGRPADTKPPKGVDYDMWLGPAPERAFNPARFHFNWRWFWDYGNGLMSDWGVHLINLALWGMKGAAPTRVSCSGGKYVIDDISETPDTQVAVYDYPGFTMIWEHQFHGGHGPESQEHGVAFHGTEGTLILDRKSWRVVPEHEKKLEPVDRKGSDADSRANHVRDFLDCCRSRKRPGTDIEIGHHVSTAAHLGNVAWLSKRSIHWDAKNERVGDDEKVDHLLTKRYRAPWKLTT